MICSKSNMICWNQIWGYKFWNQIEEYLGILRHVIIKYQFSEGTCKQVLAIIASDSIICTVTLSCT